MVWSYNNLAAQIPASKSQNNDFVEAVSLCLLIRNYRFLVVMSQTIFFNSTVTVHIKPTAPHHTTVLTASVNKNSTTRSFTHVISVRLSKDLAKDGTLATSGRFTLFIFGVKRLLTGLTVTQRLCCKQSNEDPDNPNFYGPKYPLLTHFLCQRFF